jgi:hypothetical protein
MGSGGIKILLALFGFVIILAFIFNSLYFFRNSSINTGVYSPFNVTMEPASYTFINNSTSSSFFTLRIYVNNTTGKGLPDVSVTILGYGNSQSNTTNSSGVASFKIFYYNTPNQYVYTLTIQVYLGGGPSQGDMTFYYHIMDE